MPTPWLGQKQQELSSKDYHDYQLSSSSKRQLDYLSLLR